MVGAHLVILNCTIYVLGVFAVEISHLIDTCICSLLKTKCNNLIKDKPFDDSSHAGSCTVNIYGENRWVWSCLENYSVVVQTLWQDYAYGLFSNCLSFITVKSV